MRFRNLRRDSRFAAAFASFVCGWALLMAALALSTTLRADAASEAPVVAAAAR